ncbi:MAG: serine/threonine-protein kinase [Deltaproteobacteria bacterium]
MPSARRLCPLCESEMPDLQCPTHDVPTIAVGDSQGPAAKLEIGSVLNDRYVIDGLLSQGGMGALLRARRLPEGTVVVVKVLRGQRVSEIQNVRRFYQEARVASALHHPNIVRIIEFGVDEATRAPFIAMEYVDGRTLKALIGEAGALDEKRTAALFVQIARALLAAHDHGILHRDLKPSNIMVSPLSDGEEHVKVLDFGLAKILSPDPEMSPLTQPGKTVGTPAYMSPEQVTQRPQDFRSDLYGLGCMLHAALTGGPPFTGDDLIAVMRKQMRDPPPPLPDRLFDGRTPTFGLVQLHRQLLKKSKNERPASTEEVVRTFESLLSRDSRLLTTSPKEKAHGLSIMPLGLGETSEDRGAIQTLAAQTRNERGSDRSIPNVDTDLDSVESLESQTVLTPNYTARSESATQLGGIPPALTFRESIDPATAKPFAPRDPADADLSDVFASSGAYPEATDPENAAYDSNTSSGATFGDEGTEATNEELGARTGSVSWSALAPTPADGLPASPLAPSNATEPTRTSGATDAALLATGPADDSASGLATMRGSISDLSQVSEDVLTTIVPSDLDGSEMVDAGTPIVDDDFENHTDALESTRPIDKESTWGMEPSPPAPVVPARARGSLGPATEDPAASFRPLEELPPAKPRTDARRGRGVLLVLAGAVVCVSVAVVVWLAPAPRGTSSQRAAANAKVVEEADDTPRIVPRARQVSVESRPKGAVVFRGDERLGRTPVTIDAPMTTQILRFEKRGFDPALVEIRPDVGEVLEVQLRRRP